MKARLGSMGENSKIEWCDHTFNPVLGCVKVSTGCKHCYAEAMMDARWKKAEWGPNTRRIRTSAANWRQPLRWNAIAKATGRRARVFCASLADVFEDHPDWVEPRVDLFRMIVHTPHLDWLLLTKRPENVMPMLDAMGWPSLMDNVWLGTSVEDQPAAYKRIPELRKISAKVLFLSVEPMLGPLDLEDLAYEAAGPAWAGYNKLVDWVIAGGESGPKARPMEAEWVRSLRDQCVGAGVPFFFKQWGTAARRKQFNRELVCDGRLLDGREWNEFPQVEVAYEGA